MNHPYEQLGPEAFWASAVAQVNPFDLANIWEPKFKIKPDSKVATFGSCFAQHIGQALRSNGFHWLITEPAPPGLAMGDRQRLGYDMFSCRTGNIYTATLLEQWISWATKASEPARISWNDSEGVRDPFRPRIEPQPFRTEDELFRSREETVSRFRKAIETADVFVFTLGLTESWWDINGFEYPMCPGTVAGTFDASHHVFRNLRFAEIRRSLVRSINMMRSINNKLKILLTVSPVPLTATNSGAHILSATNYSKSVLRSVAGELANDKKFIDYFPSYELILSPTVRSLFFEPNVRSVHSRGVEFVMKHFFSAIGSEEKARASVGLIEKAVKTTETDKPTKITEMNNEPQCEEQLLDAFRRR